MISCSRLFLDCIVIWRVREQIRRVVCRFLAWWLWWCYLKLSSEFSLASSRQLSTELLQVFGKDYISYGAVSGIMANGEPQDSKAFTTIVLMRRMSMQDSACEWRWFCWFFGLDFYEVLYCIFNQAREILSCMLRAFVSREYAEIWNLHWWSILPYRNSRYK